MLNIFKRIKNLWELSEYEPSTVEKEKIKNAGDKYSMILKRKDMTKLERKMAKIVDLEPEVDLL